MELQMFVFEEKAVWAELKDEFKELLKRHEIRYTDSIEVPVFSVEYVRRTDKGIKIVVQWPPEGNLIVQVHADPDLMEKDNELQQAHAEIVDFLQIWGATIKSNEP